jgi:uncharacterized protein (UPF0335 family)
LVIKYLKEKILMSDNGKTVLAEFIEKYISIENEQKLLAEDRKTLVSDYKDKLDVKAVQAALRVIRMKSKLDVSEDEFDNMLLALERHVTV